MNRISFALVFLAIFSSQFKLIAQNDIIYLKNSTKKIEQLVGDYDRQLSRPTANRTNERFGVHATDLGVPFEHNGKTYVAFGDIPPATNDQDPLAFTTDTTPEDGIRLDFVTNPDGNYRPIEIPGISMKGFEVPMEGVSWDSIMYIYATTDRMGRSVVAKSVDDGYTFTKLYDLSSTKFINVSVVKTTSDVAYPEPTDTDIQVMLGSGRYRESNIFLAYQRADRIEQDSLQYFKGLIDKMPVWTKEESEAVPLFYQPCVGELSVSYNEFINKWIVLYNCGSPRGINCRTADNPWGPWSEPFVIFDPDTNVDKGYCYFMHSSWEVQRCDNVHDPGRENEWGGEYGPYQFEKFATGNSYQTTIYYTLSTWNPYTVVLMKSTLRDKNAPITVGVDPENSPAIRIYPNPVREKVVVEFKQKGLTYITLQDMQGRRLFREKILVPRNDYMHEISAHDIPPGVYFIKTTFPGLQEVLTQKVLIK